MAIEIALVIGVVIVSVIFFLARPISEAHAERMKTRAKEMGSDSERLLKEKVNYLEGELIEVKRQLATVQETLDFVSKEIEAQGGQSIELKRKQER